MSATTIWKMHFSGILLVTACWSVRSCRYIASKLSYILPIYCNLLQSFSQRNPSASHFYPHTPHCHFRSCVGACKDNAKLGPADGKASPKARIRPGTPTVEMVTFLDVLLLLLLLFLLGAREEKPHKTPTKLAPETFPKTPGPRRSIRGCEGWMESWL